MNILFVNNFRGRGGGEEFLRDLLPGLAQKGAKVGLVCRPNAPLAGMFNDSTVNVYPISRSGRGALSSVFKIAKIIRTAKYEIIDIQRGHDIIQSWMAALLSGMRPLLIYTPQVPEFMKSRFLLRRMHSIVTISRYIREKMATYDPTIRRNIRIIHYGIDLSRFAAAKRTRGFLRNRFGLSHDTKIIGTVGDLWKNQKDFLDALAAIRKVFPGARYALAAAQSGSGPTEEFKKHAADLGLSDAVLWAGRLPKEEMPGFYADIDIAVSTHRNEGFGIWILEALAMGTPVIAYDDGGVRDSLEKCPGGLLVSGGPQEMASAVIAVLRNDSQRRQMAQSGPCWVAERFDRTRMFDDYYTFFRSMIGK